VSASSQGARAVGRQYLRSPCVSPGTVDRDAAASQSLGIVRRHTPGQQGIKAVCCYNHLVRGKYGERRSMAEDTEKLTALISETVAALTDLEGRLHLVQARVSGLGFFARGFVEKDVSGATGRTFGDWVSACERLRGKLASARVPSMGEARALILEELPRVAVFRQYLLRAPQKITMVPTAVLKPQQRGELLDQVERQGESLQRLEALLQRVAGSFAPAS
jgi:hypothetical protein